MTVVKKQQTSLLLDKLARICIIVYMMNETKNFPALFDEISAICNAWFYKPVDALKYIETHIEEYEGTRCLRDYFEFVKLSKSGV